MHMTEASITGYSVSYGNSYNAQRFMPNVDRRREERKGEGLEKDREKERDLYLYRIYIMRCSTVPHRMIRASVNDCLLITAELIDDARSASLATEEGGEIIETLAVRRDACINNSVVSETSELHANCL